MLKTSCVEQLILGTFMMKYVYTGTPCFLFLKTPPNLSLSLPPPSPIGAKVILGLMPLSRELWGQEEDL